MASIYQREDSDVWYVQFWDKDKGSQQKKSLRTKDRAEAERLKRIIEVENENGIELRERERDAFVRPVPTFADFTTKTYEPSYRNDNPKSADKLRFQLRVLLPFFGKYRLDEITNAVATDFKNQRLNATDARYTHRTKAAPKVSRVTVKDNLTTLCSILNKAVELGELTADQRKACADGKVVNKFKVEKKKPASLMADQLEALYKADLSIAPIWRFMVNTGLRRAEAVRARIEDVTKLADGSPAFYVRPSKNYLERWIPMNERAQEAARVLTSEAEAAGRKTLLPGITEDSLTQLFRRTAEKAGLKAHTHMLRHTFCSHLVNSGVPVPVVKELAGHSDIATTMRYVHLLPGAKVTAVAAIAL